jgi:hypothetical protein
MVDLERLAGSWIYERGALRRAGPAPRLSRGRLTFDLRADGSFLEQSPDQTDRSNTSSGTWRVIGEAIEFSYDDDRPSLSLPCSDDAGE